MATDLLSEAVMLRLVGDLPFPKRHRVRILNACHWNGIITVGDLCQTKPTKLLRMKNFGRRTLASVREVLANEGLSLNGDAPEMVPLRWSGWAVLDRGVLQMFTNEELARGHFALLESRGWTCRLVEVSAVVTIRAVVK